MNRVLLSFGILTLFFLNVITFGIAEEYTDNSSIIIEVLNINESEHNKTEGYRIVIINISLKNEQNEAVRICDENFHLVLSDGKIYNVKIYDTEVFGEIQYAGKKIEPGQKITTFLGFYVYDNSSLDHLYYHRGSIKFSIGLRSNNSSYSDNPEFQFPSNPFAFTQNIAINAFVLSTILIITISVIILTGTEIGKYGFFSAISPLYTKQRKKTMKIMAISKKLYLDTYFTIPVRIIIP